MNNINPPHYHHLNIWVGIFIIDENYYKRKFPRLFGFNCIYNKIFIMPKIVRLTESDLMRLVERVLRESKNETIYEDEYGSVEETEFEEGTLNEAEYQGRKVQLGKIMQGDVKKFKVYVKNDKGKVVKVNFGFGGKSAHGKRMTIKKNNPARRKSFRARHHCDNPGPRWKPNYWACRTW